MFLEATGGEPIAPELMATLNQARTLLFTEEEKRAADERDAAAKAAEKVEREAKPDEPGRQDT